MSQAITHIEVSLDQAQEQQLEGQGFKKINVSLNTRGKYGIYVWYKNQNGAATITRVQVSFDKAMCDGLTNAGYTMVDKNLVPGRNVHLWYYRGSNPDYDTPIVKLEVTTNAEDEAEKIKLNWERVGCNLNVTGKRVYLWLKREQQNYICDVIATHSFGSDADFFQDGYIRVDESTNNGTLVFIWYRQTTDAKRALTNVAISTSVDEFQQCQQQGYKQVNVKLNEGSGADPVFMWYKKEESQSPIRSLLLLVHVSDAAAYKKAGVSVIARNLNSGIDGPPVFLCVFQ